MKSKSSRSVKNFGKWVFGLFVLLAFGIYQNCSDVQLKKIQEPSQGNLSGMLCSAPPNLGGDNFNFVFVIDMSGSNLYEGGVINRGTDYEGQRFKVLEEFLKEDCLADYKNKRFAVVGFSDEILNLDKGKGCNATALTDDLEKVRGQIDELRKIQEDVVKANLPEMDSRNPMSETYYKKALDCVNSIVDGQLQAQPDEKKKEFSYLTFFVTDGAPTDNNSLGLSITIDNVDKAIDKFNDFFKPSLERYRQLANSIAGGGRLQPVLYGYERLNDVKKRLAEGVLGYFANYGESQVKTIDQIADLNLCDLLKFGLRQPYTIKKFGVVNLTALMEKGYLKADSDMDGLADEMEEELGFDPTKRRSLVNENEVIDGLCFGVSAQECQVRQVCGTSNPLGINVCDAEAFGLNDGIDSDRDDIPDLVEMLKGTNPNVDDTLSNNDGDELYLHEELAVGRSPTFNDRGIKPELLLQFANAKSVKPLAPCTREQESWNYEIQHIPLIPVVATNNTYVEDRKLAFLNHAENENVILVYYIIKKVNDQVASANELFGKFVKIDYVTGARTELGEFERLGVVDGDF